MAATTLHKSSSCLLQHKSGSTTRLNPSSLVKHCPNPTSKKSLFLMRYWILKKFNLCCSFPLVVIGVSVLGKSRRYVVTKASIEMSQSNSTPSSSVVVNSSSKQHKGGGPIIVIDNYDSFTYNLCQVPPQSFGFDPSSLNRLGSCPIASS